jgi:hypothetical protein
MRRKWITRLKFHVVQHGLCRDAVPVPDGKAKSGWGLSNPHCSCSLPSPYFHHHGMGFVIYKQHFLKLIPGIPRPTGPAS